MGFNSLGQYSASHKVWDHVGNIIPDVEHSEGERPAIEFKPAAWLPVQFYDKYYENWFVTMPGKLVALDTQGRVVPAQYGLAAATIIYTQNDIDAGTIDATTGVACAAVVTYNVSDIDGSTYDFMGVDTLALAVSSPIGVAPYAYLQWAGNGASGDDGFNPANYRKHNYNMQHQVAVLCDYVISVPLIPAVQAATSLTFNAPSSNVSTSNAVGNLPVAAHSARTPIGFTGGSSSTLFVNQVDALTKVTSTGDWFINLLTGKVSVYTGSTPGSISISYYHYASAPSTLSKFACAVGNLKPGNFVKCGLNSNFVLANGTVTDGSGDGWNVIGQVLEVDAAWPKDGLDKVRTAYSPAIGTSGTGALPGSLGQLDQMSGTATGGVQADIHYAGAANTLVRINLISR